jgi:5'-nucleotidase
MKSTLLLSAVLSSALALVAARPEPVHVDRLVSRSYYEEEARLVRRGSGFANGGSRGNSGKDRFGSLKNKKNFEISFYHVNDVHAHLDEFRPSGSSCTDPSRGTSCDHAICYVREVKLVES